MNQQSVNVQKQAYKKSYLHACKYPTEDVMGVLVGIIDKSVYKVTNAFPLFHSKVLQCTLEIALDLIQCQLQNEQKIIGIYEARVTSSGQSINEQGKEILSSIAVHGKCSPLYMKIVEIVDEDEDSSKLKARFYTLGQDEKIHEQNEMEYSILSDALKQGLHWRIVDFDAHFENISLDFTNKFLDD